MQITDDVVVSGEHFQEKHAAGDAHQFRETGVDVVILDVVQRIGADDEVERAAEAH